MDERLLLADLATEARELMKSGQHTNDRTRLTIYSGYTKKTLFDYDQYFEAITQFYLGWPPVFALNGVRVFFAYQDRNTGLLPRSVPPIASTRGEHAKPWLAQTCVLTGAYINEWGWVTHGLLDALEKYLTHWMLRRDVSGINLSVWEGASHVMENQTERLGKNGEAYCAGVDLNATLVRECQALSLLYQRVGRSIESERWQEAANTRTDAIQSLLWNEEQGMYFDLDVRTNEQIPVKAVSTFFPLFAGICTQEQADRLVKEHLMNPDEFWRRYPIPALAATEPGYRDELIEGEEGRNWRASTYISINYLVFQGLRKYGFMDEATALAKLSLNILDKSSYREWYSSETGDGYGQDPFMGSSIVGLFMTLEDEMGFDPTEITDEPMPEMKQITNDINQLGDNQD